MLSINTRYFLSLLLVVLNFFTANTQPTIDGIFDGETVYGAPIAVADGQVGWGGVNINSLYVTNDNNYIYIGCSLNSAENWQSFGIAINTIDGSGGNAEVWGFPITYGHAELPDIVVKGHFGQNDPAPYVELRKWNGTAWTQINNEGNTAGLSAADYVAEETGFLEVRVAKSVLDNVNSGDFQFYITGNNGSEHATFDACPDDEVAASWNTSTTLDNYASDIDLGGNTTFTVNPELPNDSESVTITFDANGTPLQGANKVYFHSGISTDCDNPEAFSQVIGNWGQDDGVGEMASQGNDLWTIILPGLRNYYNVDPTEDVFGLNFLFRNEDGSLQEDQIGLNYSYAVDPGDHFKIIEPESLPYFAEINQSVALSFESNSAPLSWTLDEVDEMGSILTPISTEGSTLQFSGSVSSSSAGVKFYKVSANYSTGAKYKTITVQFYEPVVEASRPSWTRLGINYHDDDPTKATLVLHAPVYTHFYQYPSGSPLLTGTNPTEEKSTVYVIGDFNNWQISEPYKMNRDRDGWNPTTQVDADADGDRGDYWWIELNNLIPGKAYVFQYLIDGQLQVADPYTEQVSDFDDIYISTERNSELLPYPSQAQGRASILQTAQNEYNWEAPAFDVPSINDLNVYELHFRDFTEEGTYLAAIDRLDYIKALGINAIHVLPVSEFEGNSSWGYNPNFYFAPDKYYGTPQDLKAFIDECHKRQILVFNDVVLNHAFYSNVMARMYWNQSLNRPADDNPWFNPEHKMVSEPAGWWGADWNHESEHTQQMVDSILQFWLEEYRFDGFRFDFTKGFGQTAQDPSDPWASSYDQNRIDLLLRMVSEMKSHHPNAIAIFEHLADASEDAVLADSGILMWSGAGHHNDIKEFVLGYNGRNIYDSGIYTAKGFTFANLMSYMESHDEERQAYEVKTYGKGNESYDTGDIIDRLKVGAVFNLLFPGPRMLWQFEELGYDISINFNGRTGEKPVHWEYYYNQARQELWRLMSMIFYLRNQYDLYATTPDYGNIGSSASVEVPRRMKLNDGAGKTVISIANLDVDNGHSVTPGYDQTGTWYKYNGDPNVDGSSFQVVNTSDGYFLNPSESLLLTNFEIGWTDNCDGPEACCVRTVHTWNAGVGQWGDADKWMLNAVPKQCDMVIIPAGSTVTIPTGTIAHAKYLWVQDGGQLIVDGELIVEEEF